MVSEQPFAAGVGHATMGLNGFNVNSVNFVDKKSW